MKTDLEFELRELRVGAWLRWAVYYCRLHLQHNYLTTALTSSDL